MGILSYVEYNMGIPFYRQEKNYTCGPASMRMVLESVGLRKSEKELARLLETNRISGTWNISFIKLAKKYKLKYVVNSNSDIKELKHLLRNSYYVIVCYFNSIEKKGHYSVTNKIGNKYIYLLDPWFGPDLKYPLKYFRKIWKSDPKYDNERCWFFAVRR